MKLKYKNLYCKVCQMKAPFSVAEDLGTKTFICQICATKFSDKEMRELFK